MPPRLKEYHRPHNLEGALELLRRPGAAPLILSPRVPDSPYAHVEAVVDLSRLDLTYIREANGGIRLGALTSLQDVIDSNHLKSQAGGLLAEAAQFSASSGLRHLASVGGVLLTREGPPEVVLALLALDASLVVRGRGQHTRDIPLADWLAGGGEFESGELLTEVQFARQPARVGGGLVRVARTPRDAAIIAAVAVIEAEQGAARRVRLAVGRPPQRIVLAETMLEGQAITPENLRAAAQVVESELVPASGFRASAEYRRHMAGVLARRAVENAWRDAQGPG